MSMNHLYFGDNLDVLRRYIKDESVDLVYLDPPFNSKQDYNVLFSEKSGKQSAAQIKAFEDTWHWDQRAAEMYHEVITNGGKVADALRAFEIVLGQNDMLAYLSMMAPRLVELHRVLKPTGSLYLHCDPTASHYLKILLDAVFGVQGFGSEVVWKRSSAHSDTKQGRKLHGHIHDIILFYHKSDDWSWTPVFTPYDEEYIEAFYTGIEDGTGRRYTLSDLTARKPGGDVSYEFHGRKPYSGRYWAYSRENMERFYAEGRLHFPKGEGPPRYKRYLDEMPGVPIQDVWTDVRPIGSRAAERLGYPTQKPEALLERIISASSHEGEVVLDPFCGCGTSITVAQKLNRRWIGIDITHLAISLMKHRLKDTFGEEIEKQYDVRGEPTTLEGARELAQLDRYQFQFWALGLVGARPTEEKKGADKGIDGRLYFQDEAKGTKQIIFEVKSGKVNASIVRSLRGVIDREGAQIGVLLTLEEPSGPMRSEAATAGFYDSPYTGESYPRLQILTIEELLNGRKVAAPHLHHFSTTFKRASRQRSTPTGHQLGLDDIGSEH